MSPYEKATLVELGIGVLAAFSALLAYYSNSSRFKRRKWLLLAGGVVFLSQFIQTWPVLARHASRHSDQVDEKMVDALSAATTASVPEVHVLDGLYQVTLPAGYQTLKPSTGRYMLFARDDSSTVSVFAVDPAASDVALARAVAEDTAQRHPDHRLNKPISQLPSGWVELDESWTIKDVLARSRVLMKSMPKECVIVQFSSRADVFEDRSTDFTAIELSFKLLAP